MAETFSALGRIEACPASEALPHTGSGSAAASEGTSRHEFLQRLGDGMPREEALALVPEEHREDCEALDPALVPQGAHLKRELALAYHPKKEQARVLELSSSRAYPRLPSGWIVGTLDVGGLLEDGRVYDGDYKGDNDDTVPSARTNLQLGAGALALATIHGSGDAVVELIRIRDDGSFRRDRAELDSFDLDNVRVRLLALQAKAKQAKLAAKKGKPLTVNRGPHCRYCPAFTACPATLAVARQLAMTPEQAIPTAVITADDAARAHKQLKLVEQLADAARAELKRFAEVEAIPLGDGRYYGPVARTGIKGAVATTVLARLHGEDVARAATNVKTSVSMTSVKESLKPLVSKDRPMRALLDEFTDSLEVAGGRTHRTEIREYKREEESA